MSLRYDQVADLIKIIDASACDDFVLETAELKLSLRRRGAGEANAPASRPAETTRQAAPLSSPGPGAPAAQTAPASSTASAAHAGHEMRAPMVGTFYRAPSPEAPPFVEVGDHVAAGQPLCVIEVMKLFTTLQAELAGKVVEIAAANGELVEYGAILFVIEPEQN